jgi:hypothetical protein
MLATQLSADAAFAQDPSAVITSPADGTWFNWKDSMNFEGNAAEQGQEVELQLLNIDSQQWEHSYSVAASSDGYVNDAGETRYPWSQTLSVWIGTANSEPGAVGDDGQRSNAFYMTVWGWGSGPFREDGHYITSYETCGREGQACCYRADSDCDSGFECGSGCDGPACGKDVCIAASSSPPPPNNPPPPSKPPASQCGGIGQACCNSSQCSESLSVCVSGTCIEPGDQWHFVCQCADSYGDVVNIGMHACFGHATDDLNNGLGLMCNIAAADYDAAICAPLSVDPGPEGRCADVIGNHSYD